MNTSFRIHFYTMDGMYEFDEVMANINRNVRHFPYIGPVPYEIHLSSEATYYMADDAVTYDDLEEAYMEWNESDEPDEWVEVIR